MEDSELLTSIAYQSMIEKGFEPDYSSAVIKQLHIIENPAPFDKESMRDLRELLWCSIDNDDSKDLDQLTVASQNADESYRICIAIADVDTLVSADTPIDLHARTNTTSIYTPTKIFSMLPEKLSTNLTSLNEKQERAAIIFDIKLTPTVEIADFEVYRGYVYNHAQLTYSGVGNWLEGKGPLPEKVKEIMGLQETLKLQDQLAQALKLKRHAQGALTFDTIEMKPQIQDEKVVSLEAIKRNRAHELIENFMIAGNTVSAKYSLKHKIPSLRRIVRVPKGWDRIVELAAPLGGKLPAAPDALALDQFLTQQKKENPDTFPDLSLAIIKLLGSGEYVVEIPGDVPIGHFGLALKDYTHSTAPNRRYPDLITQRLLKSSFTDSHLPYEIDELKSLAKHCTECEDAAARVERQVKKSAAAMLLEDRLGEVFEALVTGVTANGTWVRLCKVPLEGKLVRNSGNLDVGDKITVKLISVNVKKGFIDFAPL